MVRAAQAFCLMGVLVGIFIPYAVLKDQKDAEHNRKKGIILDKERTRKKLLENPNLKFKTTLDIDDIKVRGGSQRANERQEGQ
mmetsp:Transcript_34783/g.61231  ORF Transcript_34783/g.61231 Transcript_34783/m.61231 type:complete len:83 (+) Transcript_34783:1409-1657(+)